MKHVIIFLIFSFIAICSSTFYLEKREQVKSIDTVICKEMEGYTEDIDTGERCLVIWDECDTIYEK